MIRVVNQSDLGGIEEVIERDVSNSSSLGRIELQLRIRPYRHGPGLFNAVEGVSETVISVPFSI